MYLCDVILKFIYIMVLPNKFYDQLCRELIDFAKDFDDYCKLESDET